MRDASRGRVASRCHSSSVRNGIAGCSSRSAVSKAASMLRQSASRPEFSWKRSFFSSRYQSQNSCQKKCQSICAASW